MDELNRWHPQPEPADEELAYTYQKEEHAGGSKMQQHFAESLAQQQQQRQYYTSPPPMALNLFHPFHSRSLGFRSFGGSALPNLSFGAVAAKNEPGQPSSSILSFDGQASTLSFSGGSGWPDGGTEGVKVQQAPERRGRAPWNVQEHVIAERKRREKMQQLFMALATIVPNLTKTDKISILGSTIEYVKQLEEKVKILEERSARRRYESTVLEGKYRISTHTNKTSSSRKMATGADVSGSAIEASVHGDTLLLKIFCEEKRGVLVMVLAELENQGLCIINASVLPFTDSCLSITVTAKIGEGLLNTTELVNNLAAALRGFT